MSDRYWVGGTGNWTDATNHWSDSSGGSPNASFKPTSSDDVFFDEHSNESGDGNYTVTINSTAYCKNYTSANPPSGVMTLAIGTQTLNLYGNMTLGSGTLFTGNSNLGIIVRGTSGNQVLTTNAVPIPCQIQKFNEGSTLQLGDNLILTRTADTGDGIYMNGTGFDANGKKVTIKLPADNGTFNINGAFTFYDLELDFTNANTVYYYVKLKTDITVSNSFTVINSTPQYRPMIQGYTYGTQRTITAASVTLDSCDIRDIKGAGASDWDLASSDVGDAGHNTDITFATGINCYWVKNTGNWSDSTKWKTTSGGGTSSRIPLLQDTAIFDSNSFDTGSQTVTQDMPRVGAMNWTGATNTPTIAFFSGVEFHGSWTFISGMALSGTGDLKYYGSGTAIFTSGSLTFNNNIYCNGIGGTFRLGDNHTNNVAKTFYIQYGTFDANDFNLKVGIFYSNYTTTRIIYLGSGTIEIIGDATFLYIDATNLTFNAETSTIKITSALTANRTFIVINGTITFNNLWVSSTGDYVTTFNTAGTTWNDFKINAGRKVTFTAGTTNKVTTFTAVGSVGSLITLRSSTTTNATLTKSGGGTISCDYIDIDYITGNPDTTWYMGLNSTDGGHNSQIYFTEPPSSTNTTNFFQFI